MKKYIKFLFSFLVILTMMPTVFATNQIVDATIDREKSVIYNNELKSFYDVNDKKVDPISYNDTTYLPIRAISSLFEIPVKWDGANNKVLLGSGDIVASTVKNATSFEKGVNELVKVDLMPTRVVEYNGVIQEFKDEQGRVVYPLAFEGTTYLPIRAISNMYGASVNWNGATKQITLEKLNRVAQIYDVTVKVIDGILCTEINTDDKVENFKTVFTATGIINAEPYLNIRLESNSNSEIIGAIPQGTEITINEMVNSEKNSSWYKVSYNGVTGFVSAAYVKFGEAKLYIDMENTKFVQTIPTTDINYGKIKTLRFGKHENNVNRIVIDLNDASEFTVTQSTDKKTTYIALSSNFNYDTSIKKDNVVMVASLGNQLYLPNDNQVSNVGQTTDDDKTSVEKPVNNGNQTNNNLISSGEQVNFNQINSGEYWSGDSSLGNELTNDVNSGTSGDLNNINDDSKNENLTNQLTEEQIKKMCKAAKVTYSSSTNKTQIAINGTFKYEKFTLTNPPRVVVDINNCLLEYDGPKEITPKNQNIEQIRIAQNEIDKVRVVFQLKKEADYTIRKTSKGLEIKIDEPEYRNVEYANYKDYSELKLLDVKKSVFNTTLASTKKKLTITYTSSKFDSGSTNLKFDDEFVDTIDIRTNKIIIYFNPKIEFTISQVGDDTILKFYEQGAKNVGVSKGEFVVLLDAGHGGKDSGACRGTTEAEKHLPENQEKNYTLKIMKMIQEMLEETDGIEVRTIRDTDVYMDRFDRFDSILENKDADMLVSIHVNSHVTSTPSGFEVVYYNKPNEEEDYGITSKVLALTIIDQVKKNVNINVRGLSYRDGVELLILEQNTVGNIAASEGKNLPSTNIPAVICETCFISNDSDYAKLITEEFQEDMAEAIYKGILEAKKQMGK